MISHFIPICEIHKHYNKYGTLYEKDLKFACGSGHWKSCSFRTVSGQRGNLKWAKAVTGDLGGCGS